MTSSSDQPLVAVLGGGQLGRMLGLAGIPLGLRFRFLDPVAGAPAAAVGELVVGALGDETALAATAAGAVAVTYEWEGVPAEAARFLATEATDRPVRPGDRPLEVAQDRLAEKDTCRALGIATAPYAAVDSRAGLDAAVDAVGGLPAVLKTRRGGYDGKGQAVLREPADLDAAWESLQGQALILEGFVPFERELSVIAVRDAAGEVACWPLVENHHRDGILRLSRAPAPGLSPALQARGEEIAARIATELGHVGVLTVELFEHEGELLVNELAPRVHNSGHWTIEGADTSQFENHLRAVLGWPLGSTAVRGSAAMVNCIGAMPNRDEILAIPGAHLHDYGKSARRGRKVGHVTVTAPDDAIRDERVARVQAAVRDDG
ncbi:MAG: 5-(carboxyamino)imidazole ribonucleotide synthase [Acidimicrobiia bacterium]